MSKIIKTNLAIHKKEVNMIGDNSETLETCWSVIFLGCLE